MSRQPPSFPSKRPQPFDIDTSSYSPPITKPLQITRAPRSTAPSNASVVSNGSPTGPSRPQRSELRANKVPDYSVSDAAPLARVSRDRKDSASTTISDISSSNRDIYRTVNGNSPGQRTRWTTRSGTDESDLTSPASLTSVVSAFQSGLRKKVMTTYDDNPWEGRQQAIEAESATQERIRRRMPGRRQNGVAKTGDIDGARHRAPGDHFLIPLVSRIRPNKG
jgi:exocyst complex component 4